MEFIDAVKPCLKESVQGTLLTAGTTLISGHFSLIPITAKFITNFTFCLSDQYSESSWNEAKETLIQYKFRDEKLNKLKNELYSIKQNDISVNRKNVLNLLLRSSFGILKQNVTTWLSDEVEKIISSCLEQTEKVLLNDEEIKLLNEKFLNNYDSLKNIFGELFMQEISKNLNFVEKMSEMNHIGSTIQDNFETRESILRDISHSPYGKKARKAVEILFKYMGETITYDWLAVTAKIDYSYSSKILNKLNEGVVDIITDYGKPYRININQYDQNTFYKLARDALKK